MNVIPLKIKEKETEISQAKWRCTHDARQSRKRMQTKDAVETRQDERPKYILNERTKTYVNKKRIEMTI